LASLRANMRAAFLAGTCVFIWNDHSLLCPFRLAVYPLPFAP
jgi:hypothetical protein